MTAPQTTATTDPQSMAALQRRLDAALAREATLAEELAARDAALAQRNSEFGERIEQQTATIDVLKAMSASPGDAQPVFDLIVERAAAFCEGFGATLALLDGELLHLKSYVNHPNPAAYEAEYPRPVSVTTAFGRAILACDAIQIPDAMEDANYQNYQRTALGYVFRSVLGVPLLRAGKPIGAIVVGRRRPGEFSLAQVELLKTFAEQAVIAITGAETYRALQTRTSDLQKTLEYQTATSDVLKVISRSTFDLQPVLTMVAETAARLCVADQAAIFRLKDDILHLAVNYGFPPEYKAYWDERGPVPFGKPMVTVLSRTIHERHSVHVHDVASVPGYPDQAIRLGKQRTSLGVRLLREGEPIGVILLARQRVEPFTDRQIELVSTFADQAVIAIENTRLLTEQREALEQQTATAQVLQVINASPGNLVPVFDAILVKAHNLCRADHGSLYITDGEAFRAVAVHGMPDAFGDLIRQPFRPGPNHPVRQLLAGTPFAVVHDASEVDDPIIQGSLKLAGMRSALFVPLQKDKLLLGYIVASSPERRVFTEKQVALLQNFAAQAVIAMENARLLTETREALDQQTATAEVLQVVNASPGNLTPVFDAILDRAMRLCEAAFGSLFTYDGLAFYPVAMRGVPTVYADFTAEKVITPYPGGPLSRILATKQTDHILDMSADDSYEAGSPAVRAAVDLGGAGTMLRIPLLKDGAVQGVITIYRQEVRAFADKQIALLENFASQAVIAMENARLITEQREALEQQTATAEVLQVINANPGDLTPVFEAILEKAHDLCDIAYGDLQLYDGEHLRSVAQRGVSAGFADRLRQGYRASDSPASRPLLAGDRFTHITDTASVDSMVFRSAVRLDGIRTVLFVPLRKEGSLLGMITSARREVRPFTEKEITLLENFSAQAVIAMENARLITEQREALEQQTATAEVLQVINASPGNLAPVFDAMLEKAMRLCEAGFGSLYTYDGDRFQSAAQRGVSAAYAAYRERHPPELVGGTGLEEAIRSRRAVQVTDMMAERSYLEGNPNIRAMVDLGGMRTGVVVPLCKDETALGMISVFRQEVRTFSDKQIALLESFAAQAVIAMENARLIDEQREALEQQTATAEVLEVINASPGNLAPVFDALLEKAMRLCGAAFGSLYTYDGERFHSAAQRGVPPAYAEYRALNPPSTTGGRPPARMIETRGPVQSPDVMASDNYRAGNPYARALVDLGGIRAVLNVPLLKEGALLGFIAIYREEPGTFSDKQIALLESFAAQAVIAMENARLLSEIRQRQEELRVTFENMGDGVAMFDGTQHLVAWNRKFQDILDVPDDIIARRQTFPEYIRYLAKRGEYGADAEVEEQVRRVLETAGQMRVFERVRPNGRVIEVRSNPVAGGGFVLIYADITERKRNEAEIRAARDAAEEASRTIEAAYRELKTAQANLIQAEKMASLGQLTAGIAHEIKNPLNFVNNFAALSVDLLGELKETAAPGFAVLTEKQRTEVEDLSVMLTSNLEKITEHGKRADGIVKAMLEHSRGSSGERRVVDLNALIDEALSLAYHGARAQDQSFNVTLERDFGAGITPIEVNPQDMTRVFLNLFSNGFYAATKRARNGEDARFEPTLKVTTRNTGDAVEIRVRDNGTGIQADIRDKLFQPFFTTKPTGEGTGLGLSITYDIVTKAHGGSIAVDSKVGDYSEFTIRLPRNL